MLTKDFVQKTFFPQQGVCHLCGRWSNSGGRVCLRCQLALESRRMHGLFLPPFGATLRCCLAVWQFQEPARTLIHQLKYGGNPGLAQFIGEQMSCALARQKELLSDIDVLVPVPLHETRLQERGYNQALLLAKEISARTGLALTPEAIVRTRVTETLVHSTRTERFNAIHSAFQACPEQVEGRRILLIDDVFTTGATAMACAIALLEAGAQDVSVLTACRA